MSLSSISGSPPLVDRSGSPRDGGAVGNPNSRDAVPDDFASMLAGVAAPALLMQREPETDALALVEESTTIAVESTEDGAARDEKTIGDSPVVTDAMMALLGSAAATLDPALRAKLAVIAQRMKDEFGREVRVVEGFRTQQRQEKLFAQGRTADGPIVTWTRNSQHTQGRAADLVIDGGWDDAAGFALLRTVAEQEGLHTLGARDPGHVELRGRSAAGFDATAAFGATAATMTPVSRQQVVAAVSPMARVASPASVAGIARVADVAGVASVAGVARVSRAPAGRFIADAVVPPAGAAHAAGSVVGSIVPNGKRNGAGESASEQPRESGLASAFEQRGMPHLAAAGYGAISSLTSSPAHGGSGLGDVASSGFSTASRVDRLMDAQDAPGPRSLSRLTLSLDDGETVRIDMRGNSVGASFDMRDSSGAERIASRLGELTRALESRGLEADAFQVRSPVATRDADASRAAGLAATALRDVAGSSAARHEGRSEMNGDAHQRFAQQDEQHERARQRQEEQRRGHSIFSLRNEDK